VKPRQKLVSISPIRVVEARQKPAEDATQNTQQLLRTGLRALLEKQRRKQRKVPMTKSHSVELTKPSVTKLDDEPKYKKFVEARHRITVDSPVQLFTPSLAHNDSARKSVESNQRSNQRSKDESKDFSSL